MTAVRPDLGTIEHLDFDHQLPCEFDQCKAEPKPATHRYAGTTWCGCRHNYVICDAHTQQVRRVLHVVGTLWCSRCLSSRLDSQLCDWMTLEPLP